MFLWYTVPKDMHSSDEEYASHGSKDGRPRQSSGEEEEASADPGQVVVNEEQGAV